MLAAELALAVAPAAVGDDRGDALVDTTGVDCDRPAEARADEADALRIDRGMLRQERQCAARILDLFETDDAAEFALAVAAAAHVEAQHHVAEIAQNLGRRHGIGGGLVAAEAVQHEEGAATLRRLEPARHMHHAGELETRGREGNRLFGHGHGLRIRVS